MFESLLKHSGFSLTPNAILINIWKVRWSIYCCSVFCSTAEALLKHFRFCSSSPSDVDQILKGALTHFFFGMTVWNTFETLLKHVRFACTTNWVGKRNWKVRWHIYLHNVFLKYFWSRFESFSFLPINFHWFWSKSERCTEKSMFKMFIWSTLEAHLEHVWLINARNRMLFKQWTVVYFLNLSWHLDVIVGDLILCQK